MPAIPSLTTRAAVERVDAGTQQLLRLEHQRLWREGTRLPFKDVEFSNFSQSGEDGILWYLLSLVGSVSDVAVELGAGDAMESNTANLMVTHGWRGLLFDGDATAVERGREFLTVTSVDNYFPPRIHQAWISRETINGLLEDRNLPEVDVLSLDIDGVDYWVWEALTAIQPRVVVLEVNLLWPADRRVTVPYRPDFTATWVEVPEDLRVPGAPLRLPYCGASLAAFAALGQRKGYRLVGLNRLGNNAFLLRDDVGAHAFPEVSVADALRPTEVWARRLLPVYERMTDQGYDWVEV